MLLKKGEVIDKKKPSTSMDCLKYFPLENEAKTTCHFIKQQNKTGPNITEYYNVDPEVYSCFNREEGLTRTETDATRSQIDYSIDTWYLALIECSRSFPSNV